MRLARGTSKMAVSKLAALRRRRCIARRYSTAFLAVALTSICVWATLSEILEQSDSAWDSRTQAEKPKGTRRLVEPPDSFTSKQRRSGAVILHCIGLLYMFVCIAIVCDECFVPALEVITEVLDLSPDVAGATFMAAGGSAPEFFTSLIGSLVTESDIGTGTIIGSAVFNVLFVIGACALVAPGPLQLTWFPLARDSTFYAVDLIVVTVTFLDERVMWYEAVILLLLYMSYILFMRYNERIEAWAQEKRGRRSHGGEQPDHWAASREKVERLEEVDQGTAGTGEEGDSRNLKFVRSGSTTSLTGKDHEKKLFRHQSMRVANHVTAIKHMDSTGGSGGGMLAHPATPEGQPPEQPQVEAVQEVVVGVVGQDSSGAAGSGGQEVELTGIVPAPPQRHDHPAKRESNSTAGDLRRADTGDNDEAEEEVDDPLSIYPPADASTKELVSYALTLPVLILLVLTVPDVRRRGWRKFFVVTFTMSILWIAGFTWAMVWFATVIAETASVGEHIMGLTVLAAGTSVPDLLSSVIVAREGHGDMAISSSIGSNIFDVTIGLPVPWLIFIAYRGRPVKIKNEGLEISVMLLLLMLAFTIGTIMGHNWVMTRGMGASMIVLYVAFLSVSVGLSIYLENGGSLKLIHV